MKSTRNLILYKNFENGTLFYNMAADLHFSPEMIVLLAAYCNGIGKFSYRYMEAVAADWYDSGIQTFEQAERKIRQLEESRRLETRLKKAFWCLAVRR